jgi:hypothetical protein
MANPNIRIKRSAVPGKIPTVEQLPLGELGLNTYDAELFARRERTGIGTDIVRIGAGATVTNILYVTKDGNDTNTGKKLGDAKATIGAALTAATTGTVIKVSAGSYLENNPLVIPEQVSIVGDSLREVSVQPLNANQDLFYVSNGNYIAEMSYTGTLNSGKAIFAFNPNQIGYFNQSPYIQNCTNFIPNSIGMKIDGSKAIGPLKSMVLDSYTQYNQGGIGVSITNEGYAQLVSLFTICNDTAIFCGSGAACDLTNSNSSFGNFGLVADGIGPRKYTGIITSSEDANAFEFEVNLNTPTLNITSAKYDNVTGLLTATTNSAHNFSVGMGISLAGLAFTCASGPGIVTYPSGNKGYVFETVTVAPGRYVDAYNLIQSNKREIQDKSLASIAVEYPDFYFRGDTQTNLRSRYYDAHRLIVKNKDVIVSVAWTNTVNVYPGISTTQTKCKRDLGYFVDAVSTDVFTGGNRYAREFVRQYFNNGAPISNGLVGEETESIYAFHQAKNLMKQAITNTLVGAAYSDLTITGDPNPGSNPPPYGTQGVTTNNTNSSSCADVQSNIDNLVGIITSVITAGNLNSISSPDNYGTFTEGGSKCLRDIGYIIDAVSTDVRDFTSRSTLEATKSYFNLSGSSLIVGISSEIPQTIVGFTTARELMKLAITNNLNSKDLTIAPDPVTGSNTSVNSCADVQSFIDNLVGIITTRLNAGNITGGNALPAVSAASTTFSVYVGVSTLSHTYNSGGTAKINIIRPFDGQVVYFDKLYYSIGGVTVGSGGTGYTGTAELTIEDPETPWGIPATAVAEVKNGSVVSVEMISNGRGYTTTPRVTFNSPNVGINTATGSANMIPTYYIIEKCTPVSAGICTITFTDNVPYAVTAGMEVPFFKQSRVLASGHSLEYIGSGTNIATALPSAGGVPIQENETVTKNGGIVVFTSTDQSGNFRIGDGVVINQQTGTISGTFYSKSLFSTVTPFILALGGD